MGILRGDVEILGLANLLQMLSMNKKEGVLTLFKGMDKKSIYIGPGGMRILSSTMKPVNKLGKILVRKKVIKPNDLEDILKEQKLLGWKLGKIAITSGLAKEKDIVAGLREQIEEEIFDMFMWLDSAFEFSEGAAPKEIVDNPLAGISFDSNITSLVLEAARRADELLKIRGIVHDEDLMLVQTSTEILADRLGADIETVEGILPLIDGKRSVREIVQTSVYPRYEVLRAIYLLIGNKYIKLMGKKPTAVKAAP